MEPSILILIGITVVYAVLLYVAVGTKVPVTKAVPLLFLVHILIIVAYVMLLFDTPTPVLSSPFALPPPEGVTIWVITR